MAKQRSPFKNFIKSVKMLNENLIKGQIIELKVQEELLRYGFDISIPSYNSSKYDLIADTGSELLRIQVKKAISNSLSSFSFSCTTQNVKSSSKSKHKYTSEEIDYFATVWKDKVYLVPVDETSTQKTISFEDETYLAKNILCSYERLSDDELYNSSHSGKFYCEDCGCEISRGAIKCLPCRNKETCFVQLLLLQLVNNTKFQIMLSEDGVINMVYQDEQVILKNIQRRIGIYYKAFQMETAR